MARLEHARKGTDNRIARTNAILKVSRMTRHHIGFSQRGAVVELMVLALLVKLFNLAVDRMYLCASWNSVGYLLH